MELGEKIFLEEKPFRGFEKLPRVLLERINIPSLNKNKKSPNCEGTCKVNLKTGTKLKSYSSKLSLKCSVRLIRQDMEKLKREFNKINLDNIDNTMKLKDTSRNILKTSKTLQIAAKPTTWDNLPQKRSDPKQAIEHPQEDEIANDTFDSVLRASLIKSIINKCNLKECNVNQNLISKNNIGTIGTINAIDNDTQISSENDSKVEIKSENSMDVIDTTDDNLMINVRDLMQSEIYTNSSLILTDDQKFKRNKISQDYFEKYGKSYSRSNFFANHEPIQDIKCDRAIVEQNEGIGDVKEPTLGIPGISSGVKELPIPAPIGEVKENLINCADNNNAISRFIPVLCQDLGYRFVVQEVPIEF